MHRSLLLWLAVVLIPSTGWAQDTKWSGSVAVGWEPSLSGNVTSTVSGGLNGTAVVFGTESYSDVYGTPLRWKFGAGYMLSESAEVFGALSHVGGDADRVPLGIPPGPGYVAQMDSLSEWTFEVGYRRHFGEFSRHFHPTASATIGFSHVGSINGALTIPGVSTAATNLPITDDSTAFTLGFSGGVEYRITPRVGATGELGVRWRGGLGSANGLAGTGLDQIAKDTARWSLPIMFGAIVHF